ncbi:MAG: IS6 family transposase [Pseudoruegeria sp.]
MYPPSTSGKRHRFLSETISHAIWLYCRFNISLREGGELFLERGIDMSYEPIRRWVGKFGPIIARGIRWRQRQSGDVWHLDEVVVTVKGRKFWLWRAVDQSGLVLDEILQSRRNTKAAKRLIQRHRCTPNRFITDKLRSYDAAKRAVAPGVMPRC